jgi:protein-disulfide isomerase
MNRVISLRLVLACCLLALSAGRAGAQAANARGPADAPVAVIVFSAFECPFSAEARHTLEQIEADYPGKIRLIYKHFPLAADPAGYLPHQAAEAAARQGKFWEMHDALFARQKAGLDRPAVERLARELNLDIQRFAADLDQQEGNARIEADLAEAKGLKVKVSPTFYIDGYKLDGAQPPAVLRTLIDHQLSSGPSLLDAIKQARAQPAAAIEARLRNASH